MSNMMNYLVAKTVGMNKRASGSRIRSYLAKKAAASELEPSSVNALNLLEQNKGDFSEQDYNTIKEALESGRPVEEVFGGQFSHFLNRFKDMIYAKPGAHATYLKNQPSGEPSRAERFGDDVRITKERIGNALTKDNVKRWLTDNQDYLYAGGGGAVGGGVLGALLAKKNRLLGGLGGAAIGAGLGLGANALRRYYDDLYARPEKGATMEDLKRIGVGR